MEEILTRIWQSLVGRAEGPMSVRMYLQPTMAALLAVLDGVKDAKAGKPPWLWAALFDPQHRAEILRSGWKTVSKIFFIAVALDVVYQIITRHFERIHLLETLVIACILALVPYSVLRGPANRVTRMLLRKP
jgi:hypothetical protein